MNSILLLFDFFLCRLVQLMPFPVISDQAAISIGGLLNNFVGMFVLPRNAQWPLPIRA